jgi:hypothetical protein
VTFDALTLYPLFITEVSCHDGKFGTLHGTDPDTQEAVVAVHRERSYRLIPAKEIEFVDGRLVQVRSSR